MRQFLALQEFTPVEQSGDGRCIWCGKTAAKNRSHIISRKLTGSAKNTPTLTRSVCVSCNTICGKTEDWILHHTPIGWARYFLYPSANSRSNPPHTPAYWFVPALDEWLVHTLNPATRQYVILPQLLLSASGQLRLFTSSPPNEAPALSKVLFGTLRCGQFNRYVFKSLVEDFRPRAISSEGKTIIVARTEAEASALVCAITDQAPEIAEATKLPLSDCGARRQHFRWSKGNWVKFCAKVAFETLALFEGQAICTRPCFNKLRDYVLCGPTSQSRELLFDEHGPISEGDVPKPVCIDLTVGQNCPVDVQALISITDSGMHSVTLCEIEGWICCSLSFLGLPPSVLILGGPEEHLGDLYELVFDEQESEFHYSRLAFDPSKPVFPKEVGGNAFASLVKTYRLEAVQPASIKP